jgi:hypothetical protein
MDDATIYSFRFLNIPGAIPGDYNEDGKVNGGDYVAWRKYLNTPSTYEVWRQHFGETSSASSSTNTSVPEPGTLAVAILTILGAVAVPRLRR